MIHQVIHQFFAHLISTIFSNQRELEDHIALGLATGASPADAVADSTEVHIRLFYTELFFDQDQLHRAIQRGVPFASAAHDWKCASPEFRRLAADADGDVTVAAQGFLRERTARRRSFAEMRLWYLWLCTTGATVLSGAIVLAWKILPMFEELYFETSTSLLDFDALLAFVKAAPLWAAPLWAGACLWILVVCLVGPWVIPGGRTARRYRHAALLARRLAHALESKGFTQLERTLVGHPGWSRLRPVGESSSRPRLPTRVDAAKAILERLNAGEDVATAVAADPSLGRLILPAFGCDQESVPASLRCRSDALRAEAERRDLKRAAIVWAAGMILCALAILMCLVVVVTLIHGLGTI